MNDTLKTDQVIEYKVKYFIVQYTRAWSSYHIETSLHFLYAYYMAGFFMILILIAEILNRL